MKGIPVDHRPRTNVKNIYATGDVAGGYQFTHFAGWQAFQAVRNALLPESDSVSSDLVPWVTSTDPEVAGIDRDEGDEALKMHRRDMNHLDRVVYESDTDGFKKFVAKSDGTILGATIVAARGEAITDVVVALKEGMKRPDLRGRFMPVRRTRH